MCRSKPAKTYTREAFSLPEVAAALVILALITSAVLVVINRCAESAINRRLRIEAFHLARENMEKLLASDSVEETLEYAGSDDNPNIQSKTLVEPFYESLTGRMWIRSVCSATYTDSRDQEQTVELTHWLTDLTLEQMMQVAEQRKRQSEHPVDKQVTDLLERVGKGKLTNLLERVANGEVTDLFKDLDQEEVAGILEDLAEGEVSDMVEILDEEEITDLVQHLADEGTIDPQEIPQEIQEQDRQPRETEGPEEKDEARETPSTERDRFPWLPENWDSMSREEKLNWMMKDLQRAMKSRR